MAVLRNLPRAACIKNSDTPTVMATLSVRRDVVLKTGEVFRSLLCSSSTDTRLPTRLQQAFRTLGLEDEHVGSAQQVRKAFIKMAKRFHPDAQTTEASAEKFAKVRHNYCLWT